MKTEFLKSLGLDQDAIDKIMAENGKDIEAHKKAAEAAATDLATANKTIQDLQAAVKKFDGVDVEKLKGDLATLQQKYDADLASTKLSGALEAALLGAKSKNTKAVRALLNLDDIKLDGDKLLGLDTQLEKLKTDAAYLFDADKPGATVDSGLPHGAPIGGGSEPKNLREALEQKMNQKGE